MASESPSRLPVPIAKMAPWDFWASPYTIGLSTDDAEAIERGNPLPDQIDRAQKLCEFARRALMIAPHNEPRRAS